MKAHEGTLRHLERQALARGEGEIERVGNPGIAQLYVKKKYGKSHRYYKAPEEVLAEFTHGPALNLTEHNQVMLEYHKSQGQPGSLAGVLCPSPNCDGKMVYRSDTVKHSADNFPAKREVSCMVCGRTGVKLIN